MTPEERAAWLLARNIECHESTCPGCNEPCRIDTPMRYHGAVGMMAEPCTTCGNDRMPFMFHWNELAALGERERAKKPKRSRVQAKVIPMRRPS
jgi:hypothetical protein